MTTTKIMGVFPGSTIIEPHILKTLRNSWWGAPVIWEAMANDYLDCSEWESNPERLWNLVDRSDIVKSDRTVLMLTFDRFYVKNDDYLRAASDIEAFASHRPLLADSHLPHIASVLRSNPMPSAIAMWWCSVSENPFAGKHDSEEEGGKCTPFDWSTAYDLYKTFDLEVVK